MTTNKILLNRIIIFSEDPTKLKIFYQDFFDLELIEEITGEWVVLRAGHIEMAFHKIGAAYDNNNIPIKADSNTKLVFDITADLSSFRELLLAKGIALQEIKSYEANYLHCDGEDPEGNVFQLRQKLS